MSGFMVVLRIVHILCGVFWAGSLIFMATFLEPSVRAAGPDGAKVMQQIQRRRLLDIMPVIALLTILSGLALLERLSGGFSPEWLRSGMGMSLSLGGLSALVAFVIGVFVMRRAALRAAAAGQAALQLPEGTEREARLAEVQALRRRAAIAGRWVAALLGVAVTGMALSGYV